jgi:hypothetical protein
MAVERKEPRILALQRLQAVEQSDVFGHIGEIACVIDMSIIHVALCLS